MKKIIAQFRYNSIGVDDIFIYNTSGQQVEYETLNSRKIDISKLPTGIYFMQINTSKGIYNKKIIKVE